MSDRMRQRRALTHVGGAIATAGDEAEARLLARALDVAPSTDANDDPARAHVHGFHSYPARMHPQTAARLVEAFSPRQGRILDPFCGSGTVLVEAVLAGRNASGTDLNPLAVRLAHSKTRPHTPTEHERLISLARDCAAHAEDRRKRKAGASRHFPHEDVALFEPHVLLELDSLRDKIRSLPHDPTRGELELVLSSILVKFSRKRGDTSGATRPRRTAPGFAAKMFVQKAEDWVRRWSEFAEQIPTPPPEPPRVREDDATRLESVPPGSVDAIVTSPPYAATYDYVSHHAMRMRWLGLDATRMQRGELGSRSAYRGMKFAPARANWAEELGRFLSAAKRVLRPGAPLVLVLADSAISGAALRADEIVAEVAPRHQFAPIACASQDRPHFHGPTTAAFRDRPRREHAILLRNAVVRRR
ncbi:MAG: site-specific DNA-methyltransferase [Bacteroidales bacterium]|nr:site-specific DNA-methyltransferase [Bacteroidales bacterium]